NVRLLITMQKIAEERNYWENLAKQLKRKESKTADLSGTKLIKNIDTNEQILFLLCILVARFDLSWGRAEFHQETLENRKAAIKSSKKLCAVMLETGGPELQVVNKSENPISLQADSLVVLTPDQDKEATSNLLPINFSGLLKVNFAEEKETKYVLFWKFSGTAPPGFLLH
ncbi:pyruvate kinase 1, cytosolic, partial [Nicotiana attenuata]